jgi:hypothetical protein
MSRFLYHEFLIAGFDLKRRGAHILLSEAWLPSPFSFFFWIEFQKTSLERRKKEGWEWCSRESEIVVDRGVVFSPQSSIPFRSIPFRSIPFHSSRLFFRLWGWATSSGACPSVLLFLGIFFELAPIAVGLLIANG